MLGLDPFVYFPLTCGLEGNQLFNLIFLNVVPFRCVPYVSISHLIHVLN